MMITITFLIIQLFSGEKQQTPNLVLATSLAHHTHYSELAVEPAGTNIQHSPLDFYVHNIFRCVP